MQQQPKKRLLSQFIFFLVGSRGQVFAKCCAYGALGCIATCILFTDYSRLAILFMLPALFLSYLGVASRSHRRMAQVALVLWVILANSLFITLVDLGNQASQQARLQQQIVQLENQHSSLQSQMPVLKKQQPLLQTQFDHLQNPELPSQLSADLAMTKWAQSSFDASLQYTNSLINYDILLMQNNQRNLPNASLINANQQAIKDNDEEIQLNRQFDMSQQISLNNSDLPVAEKVPFTSQVYQNSCVNGYTCLVQPSWQQSFVDDWQRITADPLSATWFFWLSLLLALLGLFLLLPLNLGPGWVVSYQIMYSGLLSNLNDPGFPEQKRQELKAETALVKIEVRSSRELQKQVNQSHGVQDFLLLSLGIGTTILDVFPKKNIQQTEESGTSEVCYDKTTGKVILKLQPGTPPQVTRKVRSMRTLKAVRLFPIQFYVVVDYFAGSIDGVTPVAGVERLQVQQGPRWLGTIATSCHEFVWWAYATGCYIALMNCSYTFFRGIIIFPLFLFPWGVGLLIAGLVLKGTELIIIKVTTRRQRVGYLNQYASLVL